MALRTLFASIACLAFAAPGAASVTVIGGSAARQCYEAAGSPLSPRPETLQLCDQAIDAEPLSEADRVATFVNRGILRVRDGRIVEGLADFDEAIRRDPNLAEAWFNRGVALMRTGGPERALPAFEEAVALGTQPPALAYFGRAAAHEALGNMRAAYADYRRASELDPAWDRPRAELARFSVRPR
ncbi:MAG TPA: tetratricopeptide repeat protein [Allosphingosinicella sp.]|jgi:tetratricopeptide (TPR) repeat protein